MHLNQGLLIVAIFTYGCRRRAMLSFWQLWLTQNFTEVWDNTGKLKQICESVITKESVTKMGSQPDLDPLLMTFTSHTLVNMRQLIFL